MPEVPELVSSVVAGAGVAGNDGSGAIGGVIAVAVAASPPCVGTSTKHTNLRPSGTITGIDSASSLAGLQLSSFCHV